MLIKWCVPSRSRGCSTNGGYLSFYSRDDGETAIHTSHTPFDDVSKPEDAPLREFIELRMLVFYDD